MGSTLGSVLSRQILKDWTRFSRKPRKMARNLAKASLLANCHEFGHRPESTGQVQVVYETFIRHCNFFACVIPYHTRTEAYFTVVARRSVSRSMHTVSYEPVGTVLVLYCHGTALAPTDRACSSRSGGKRKEDARTGHEPSTSTAPPTTVRVYRRVWPSPERTTEVSTAHVRVQYST